MRKFINLQLMKVKKNPSMLIILVIGIIVSGVILKEAGLFNIRDLAPLPKEMNGGSSGIDGTFAPYALLVYPEVNTELGYDSRVPYQKQYIYKAPIKFVLHDYDGDLKSYTVDWKVTASWGIMYSDSDVYSRLSEGSLTGTVYDREVSTSITYEWWWSGLKKYTNVFFTIHLKFHMVDVKGNIKDMEQIREIEGKIGEEKVIEVPTTVVVEDNTDDQNPPAGDYFDDPFDNFGDDTASIEFFTILVALPVLYIIRKRKLDAEK